MHDTRTHEGARTLLGKAVPAIPQENKNKTVSSEIGCSKTQLCKLRVTLRSRALYYMHTVRRGKHLVKDISRRLPTNTKKSHHTRSNKPARNVPRVFANGRYLAVSTFSFVTL